jgi:hypothetical protein
MVEAKGIDSLRRLERIERNRLPAALGAIKSPVTPVIGKQLRIQLLGQGGHEHPLLAQRQRQGVGIEVGESILARGRHLDESWTVKGTFGRK